MDIPKVGEILRVAAGSPEKHDAKWLEVGDIVKVIGNYDNIFMVESLKGGRNGFRIRQCYPNSGWRLSLCRI